MLEKLTDEELDAWRAQPTTELLRGIVKRSLAVQKDAALQAYWAGTPWTDSELSALRKNEELWDDFFQSSADDLRTVMEQFDEYERHSAD